MANIGADDIKYLKSVSSILSTIDKQWSGISDRLEKQKSLVKQLSDKTSSYSKEVRERQSRVNDIQTRLDKLAKADVSKMSEYGKAMRDREIERLKKEKSEEKTLFKKALNNRKVYSEKERIQGEILKKLRGQKEVVDRISGTYKLIKKIAGEILNLYDKYDAVLLKISEKFGLTRNQSDALYPRLQDIVNETIAFGGTLDDVLGSISAITSQISVLGSEAFKDLNKNIVYFNKEFQISFETSAKFVSTLSDISNKSLNSQKSMLLFAKYVSDAYNVPLPQVMNDVANASDSVRSTFSGSTQELIEQAAQLRQINSSLEAASKSAESLFNFSSSYSAELRASALLGKSLNLNEARRLFFNGNLIEGEKELLRQIKSVGDFTEMNYFQRKAIADAVGKSVSEVQKLVVQEKNLDEIREKTPGYLEKEQKLKKELENLLGTEEEQRQRMLEVQAEDNLENLRASQIAAKREQIMINLGKAFKPIAEFLTVIKNVFFDVLLFISDLASKASGLVSTLTLIAGGISAIIALGPGLKLISTIFEKRILSTLKMIPNALSSVGKSIGGFIGGTLENLSKATQKINPVSIAKAAGSLVLMAGAIAAIGLSLKTLKDGPSMGDLGIMVASILAIGTLAGIIGAFVPLTAAIIVGSAAIIAMGGAIGVLGKGLQQLPGNLSEIGKGLTDLSLGLIAFSAASVASVIGGIFSFFGGNSLLSDLEGIGEIAIKYSSNITNLANGFTTLSTALSTLTRDSSMISNLFESLNKIEDFDGKITLDVSPEAKTTIETFSDSNKLLQTLNSSIESLNNNILDLKKSMEQQNVAVYLDAKQLSYNLARSDRDRGYFGVA